MWGRFARVLGFNPSYGLHALRARCNLPAMLDKQACFNPSYGLHALRACTDFDSRAAMRRFQSLIWVACPTGPPALRHNPISNCAWFQSLIWVACPTGLQTSPHHARSAQGFNPSYGLHALRAAKSLPQDRILEGFNPSYGLHALRARHLGGTLRYVSGFNPSYGLHALRA